MPDRVSGARRTYNQTWKKLIIMVMVIIKVMVIITVMVIRMVTEHNAALWDVVIPGH